MLVFVRASVVGKLPQALLWIAIRHRAGPRVVRGSKRNEVRLGRQLGGF